MAGDCFSRRRERAALRSSPEEWRRGRGVIPGPSVVLAVLRFCAVLLSPVLRVVRRAYFRPLSIAVVSSPLPVSPLASQAKAPPRPWLLAQAILVAMVAGVS